MSVAVIILPFVFQVPPHLPFEFTYEGMLERLYAFTKHHNFCNQRNGRTNPTWPPLSARKILVGNVNEGCDVVCAKKGEEVFGWCLKKRDVNNLYLEMYLICELPVFSNVPDMRVTCIQQCAYYASYPYLAVCLTCELPVLSSMQYAYYGSYLYLTARFFVFFILDKICEPAYFPSLNAKEHFPSCNSKSHKPSLVAPGIMKNSECIQQANKFFYSCTAKSEFTKRLCPCRDFVKGQTALCKDCLDGLL